MKHLSQKLTRLGYKGDPRVPAAQAGWEDARQGHPIDYYLIDRLPPVIARAYEEARMRVLLLRDVRLPIPEWRDPKFVPHPIQNAFSLTDSLNDLAVKVEGSPYWPNGSKFWKAPQ